MSAAKLDWLTEVLVIEEICLGIVTHGGCPDWTRNAVEGDVFRWAAMLFAHRLGDPATRGGQKVLAAALKQVRDYCISSAIDDVRRHGGDLPTDDQIAEYARRGREAAEAAQKRVDDMLAEARVQEAAA